MISNPNMKTVCDNCSAQYIVKHDLPEDDYIEQFCPFRFSNHNPKDSNSSSYYDTVAD